MSRVKVKEEVLGPLVAKGPQFIVRTWNCYLAEGDAEPLTIEYEIPFNISTVLIEQELMAAGCWRKDSENCFLFSNKMKDAVFAILSEALVENPDDESQDEASSPPKQHLHNTTPAKLTEHRKRLLYQDVLDTATSTVFDLGHGVKMISLLDGRVGFEGTVLKNTAPLLETILHFLPLGKGDQPLDTPQWISSWPLNQEERNFVLHVIRNRIPALVANQDQLVIIPEEAEPVPQRFRPRTLKAKALNGPYISRQSKRPYNVGRQYFSTFNKDDKDGFLWADGTTGWSVENKQRAADYEEKLKQQGLLHLLGEFDMLDPGEMLLEEEGSDEWDGEMCAGMPKVEIEVAASPTKRQRC